MRDFSVSALQNTCALSAYAASEGAYMVEIHEAEIADIDEIIKLQRLSYQSEAKIYNDWSLPALTQTVESLRGEFVNSIVLKAIANDEIIGSVRATMSEGTCKIGRLIVHPDFQKQGVGSRILNQIEMLHSHALNFELFTGSKSLRNIKFYQQHNYSISHTEALAKNISIIFMVKANINFMMP